MAVHALVPFQRPGTGKSRLAPALTSRERAELAHAMLADVVAALHAAETLATITVMTPGDPAERLAALEVAVVADDPRSTGLDASVRSAAAGLRATDELLVVMADLPCLTSVDVGRMLAAADAVVIARTDDGGTGGLLRRPHNRIATAFGHDSAQAHQSLARAVGARTSVVTLDGFRRDVDVIDDIRQLNPDDVGPHTAAALEAIGLPTGSRSHHPRGPDDGESVPAATSR
ncbi:MAG: 2-phospho-L-lactate guanylyltransferase [Nitriliruptoraceae bacterium]